ncbi:MAG TPA: dihydroorotase family protein [Candidatus Dormibacteraeota bacterium]|nr:dihydroorotase family protein [Candidatus Dormibacteraeota bacterium]
MAPILSPNPRTLGQLLFVRATVHTPDGPRALDVRVADGVITGLESGGDRGGATVVDVRGMYLLPGAIDVHVHSRDPGFPEKEDFGTLTAAAAAGGVTMVIDMPNTVPATDAAGMLESKSALARGRARVDFGLWALVRSTSTPEQLRALASAGATGFKAYLGYAFKLSRKQVLYSVDSSDPDLESPPDYGTLARLAPVIAEIGLPLVIHAEDPGILKAFARPFTGYADVLAARPPEAEAVAISAAAVVARQAGVHLHVAHLSSALGLAALEQAEAAGANVTAETCPPYLWLTDADFPRLGTAMKMAPPVRTDGDRAALRDGLKRGAISLVATDHAPHTDAEKARDLDGAPPGSPGVQSLYLSCLQLAQDMGDVWLAPRWVAEQPARLARIGESKGRIATGFDADLVVVDPEASTSFAPSSMRSRQRHHALQGMKVDFAIHSVYVRGNPVFRQRRLSTAAGGRMVHPA